MNPSSLWQEVPVFDQTMAYKELLSLAASPLDLTKEGSITKERIEQYQAIGAGYSLLYAFERISDSVLSCLFSLAKERKAHELMHAMQKGEVVNVISGYPSENRPALHTATRDIFDQSISPSFAREASLQEHAKLKKFLEKASRFKEMIFVGIGGSELGPSALYQSLGFYTDPQKKVHFVGNIDPDDVSLVLRDADLTKALVVVISKSGTTLETATNEAFLRDEYQKRGLNPKEHFVAVTMPKTPMDALELYLERFYLWDYVGGRYSGTSMVGGLLLGFTAGYEAFYECCKGAHDMDKVALREDTRENLPLIGALIGIWNRNFLGYPTVAVIPYSRMLKRFPAHLQQCDMESNGKHIDRKGSFVSFHTGPVVWGEPGTNAQHSFFQLLHQGTDVVPLEIIGYASQQTDQDFDYQGTTSQEKLLANLFAQAIALALGQKNSNPNKVFLGNRPSSILMAKKLTPYSLGALLAYYEHKIAFQGFIWGINSFDQEGVQLGKVLADKVLHLFCARKSASRVESFPIGDALCSFLDGIR